MGIFFIMIQFALQTFAKWLWMGIDEKIGLKNFVKTISEAPFLSTYAEILCVCFGFLV